MKLWQTYATTARMRGEKYSVLRLYALRGLGGLAGANDEVVSVLQRVAATEKDTLLRREAVTALHNLGTRNPSAEKALAELAGEKRDSSMEVRLAALRALGDMKSLETGPASRSLLAENPSPENKRLAVYALIQAGNEPAYEVLFDLSTDEDVNELLIPLLEEADPAILEALIDRRLKREENEEIRSILEGVLAGYARSL
jgi:HEAT repeat protein